MHDHPSMFVISKILYGNARKLSYNITNKQDLKH